MPLAADHLDAWVDLTLLGLAADGSEASGLGEALDLADHDLGDGVDAVVQVRPVFLHLAHVDGSCPGHDRPVRFRQPSQRPVGGGVLGHDGARATVTQMRASVSSTLVVSVSRSATSPGMPAITARHEVVARDRVEDSGRRRAKERTVTVQGRG